MDTNSFKTYSAKASDVENAWLVVDAENQVVGRLASQVAALLRGKHKPTYTPHVDTGDHLVVVNVDKIRVTGRKLTDKVYYRHTGYIGNMKAEPLGKLLERAPERALELAVKGMLPRGPLGRKMFKKLHVFSGATHPHAAQQPKALEV